ncbi:MAG: right-handed parallel beta-helix repeat-containing protein [Planctomycetota bacterium]|nr:right-handed parallel beta-helix repeat-containing protein [Planctomycetota bacterium]
MNSTHKRISIFSMAALLSLFCLASELHAGGCGTTLDPGFHGGETWTLSGSPYCVTGDINLSLITIEPGVVVLVDGPYEINVQSTITAIGTDSQPIIFTAKDPAVKWKGLRFQDTPPGSQLVHCRIEHSNRSGLTLINSAPVISHCYIAFNTLSGSGGGINADLATGDLVIDNSTITGNTATSHGGGIDAIMGSGELRIADSNITHNTSNPSTSSGNRFGGGIRIDGDLYMTNSRIENNRVNSCAENFATRSGIGGGIYMSGGDTVLNNCVIKSNYSRGTDCGGLNTWYAYGSGLYLNSGVLMATNCLVSGNTATPGHASRGSGLYVNAGIADIINCTFGRNQYQGIGQAGGAVNVVNSILYFNNGDGVQLDSAVVIDYSDIQGWDTTLPDNNIKWNPVFKGSGSSRSDLIIQLGSLCMDAGDETDPAFDDTCFPPSIGGSRNDMGVHGGPLGCNWGKVSDLNSDDFVDVLDLLALLGAWGPCPGDRFCPEDINGDGSVDVTDLLTLLGDWG